MTDQGSVVLTNDVVSIRLDHDRGSSPTCARLRSFLAPVFREADAPKQPDFSLQLCEFKTFPEHLRAKCTRDVRVRKSPKAIFDLTLRACDWDGKRIGLDDSTETAFSVDPSSRRIVAYVSDRSFVHLIELVRYGSLLLEESRGTVLLHASAVLGESGVVPVIGVKGAGKTTTLFKLVQELGLQYFSGDKLLLRAPPAPLRAWPDYPHVGIGTLKGFPALARQWDIHPRFEDGAEKPDHYKELIEPELFARTMRVSTAGSCSRVSCVLFPAIGAAAAAVTKVPDKEKTVAALAEFVEYPFEFTPGHWHGLFAPATRTARNFDPAALQPILEVPWYRVQGKASLESVILS